MFRARVISGAEARLQQFIRDEAVGRALQVPGLLSFQPAVRTTDAGVELVIVSTWTGFEDIAAAGRDLDTPLSMPDADRMLAGSRAEHYELVIGASRAMPLREAKLRLTRIPINPNAEAQYYQAVRRWSDRLLDESGMVAFSLGRRVVGRQDDIVAVQIWQDEASLLDVAGTELHKPMGASELSRFWAADPSIEHFDALTAIEPGKDAPAILLADDDRRYVHATPAAALLSGHSVARLLTMRVEDVARESERPNVAATWSRFMAEGAMHGPYVLERPDGSEVHVLYSAKANAPWPGSHASLLVPTGGDADLDLDQALADAGLVAKYAPVASR
ncbi:MAG TPA: PAS domain-containing protein [Candidatus Limnocylindria bacterium]|nr:PAS domain-containing protein [Candidatus Limnocylindria bacterium]